MSDAPVTSRHDRSRECCSYLRSLVLRAAPCCFSRRSRRRQSRLGGHDDRWARCRDVVGDRRGRRRRLGVDVLAVLALVGTLVVGEYFAGAVITVMLASGRALEARAAARARHELHALLERAPRVVHRYADGS